MDWTAYVFGCFAGIVPWIAVAIYLAGAGGEGGEVPGFVYGIFFSIFVVFNVFAANMLLQYKRVGPWRNYVFGKFVYVLLSHGEVTAGLAGVRGDAPTKLSRAG